MASTDARPIPQKNVAYRITFPIFDADGDLVTGATGLDSEVSKDGAAFADCTNEATEITTASGMYYLDLTSTEMNADTVAVIVKTTSTGAKTTPIVMYPEEAGDIRVNVTAYGGTAGTFASGRPEVNTTHVAGTAQTAGDLKASLNTIDDFIDTEIGTLQSSITTIDDLLDTEVAAIKTVVDAIEVDTQDIQARIPAALTVDGNIKADTLRVGGTLQTAGDIPAMVTTVDDFLDTEIGAIKAKTDNLPADPADASDIASSFSTVNSKLDTIDDFIDTEVSAVKTVTDKLDSALELDGAVYRYTTNALELAPTGGSAPTAADIRAEIDANSTKLDVAVSTRASQTSLDTLDDYVDTEVAAIKAKTDNLPADPADASDIAGSFTTVNTKLDTIDDFLDTEVNAIKTVTDKLDSALELDGAVYRYTTNALEQAPTSGGAGLTAEETAEAVWNATVDTYQADRSFGSKIGLHLPVVSPDIDYKRISKVVKEEVSQIPTPDIKPTDLAPIIKELEKVMAEVKSIKFPEIPKTDLQPLVKQLEELQQEVNSIEIPKTDLSAINEDLELLSINVHRIIEDVGDIKKGQLGRIREFFEADIDEIKTKISEVREDFRKYPRLKLTDRKNDS